MQSFLQIRLQKLKPYICISKAFCKLNLKLIKRIIRAPRDKQGNAVLWGFFKYIYESHWIPVTCTTVGKNWKERSITYLKIVLLISFLFSLVTQESVKWKQAILNDQPDANSVFLIYILKNLLQKNKIFIGILYKKFCLFKIIFVFLRIHGTNYFLFLSVRVMIICKDVVPNPTDKRSQGNCNFL